MMTKLLILTILCLSFSAFAEEPAVSGDLNDKNSKHEPEKTEAGTLAIGHTSDCVSCTAAEGATSSSILSRQDQPPSAATSATADANKATGSKSKKGDK